MAKKNRLSVDFAGFAAQAEKLENLGGDLRAAVNDALEQSKDLVDHQLETEIIKHHRSGFTEKSLRKDAQVEWFGNVAEVKVGFDIANGGLPSIFLMYGTPKHMIGKGQHPGTDPDKQLYEAVYGNATKKKVRELQARIFAEAIKAKMGG